MSACKVTAGGEHPDGLRCRISCAQMYNCNGIQRKKNTPRMAEDVERVEVLEQIVSSLRQSYHWNILSMIRWDVCAIYRHNFWYIAANCHQALQCPERRMFVMLFPIAGTILSDTGQIVKLEEYLIIEKKYQCCGLEVSTLSQ